MLKTLSTALVALSLLPSCVRNPNSIPPPPVERGTCLVARWVGGLASDQTCQFGGYSWHCVSETTAPESRLVCDRGPELGEAPARMSSAAIGAAR